MDQKKVKKFYQEHLKNSMFYYAIGAVILCLYIETLGRQEIPGLGGLLFMVSHPILFFYNAFLIFACLSVGSLFRRRAFVTTVIAGIWFLIGTANGVILTQRMTPFTMKDLSSMADGATIITNYMSWVQLAMIGAAILLALVGLVLLWVKGPKKKTKVNLKRNLAVVLLVIVMAFSGTVGLIKVGTLSTFFGNLAYAYDEYGVAYCFINTWLNQGIHKSADYSESEIEKILKESKISKKGKVTRSYSNDANEKDYPNILFLQLESFVDPTLFRDVELSQDPIPNYRKLMKQYSSGSLTVPACGAGTANTEFEAMTGLSVKFFGPGEYPFKSVLKEKTAESVVWDLHDMGYSTHAIHNHRAMFYNRNTVFDNLGFDTFTSVEYMSDVVRTPKNWAKDSILVSQIRDALASSKGRDYIYTISVQGHGKYPTEKLIADPAIQVTSAENEESKNKYEYYVNQVYEMDQFVKKLTDTLAKYDEPVVLVMYGDHIPALDMTEDSYEAKDLYQTQYIIWDNFGMKKKDKNLTSYQIAAEVLGRVGIHKGTTTRYHQNVSKKSKDYSKNLKMLGYDMLYGQQYIYGGKNPYKKAGMKMGVKEIKIEKVVYVGGKYYIKGKNFTENSKVSLDGKLLKTVYLGPSLLGLTQSVDPNDASKMKVSQIDKNNDTIISTTE